MKAKIANTASGRQAGMEIHCSVGRTLEILSDPWAFLVIREAFFGIRRFQEFHAALGVPRGTLADRLRRLTGKSILRRVQYRVLPDRFEYRLTQRGFDLYPSFLALMRWGDRWLAGRGEAPPLALFHKTCGHWVEPRTTCSRCTAEIRPEDVAYRAGLGSGQATAERRRRNRRASDPEHFLRGRPCSVAKSLQVIGDRWSFLVIREAFFGVRRYDEIRTNIGIATNILADRLQHLVAEGIFRRSIYRQRPERFEYRLTAKGLDLYASLIVMMRWGDKWLSRDGAPLILAHRCGHDFEPVVACNHCGGELEARAMGYASTAAPPAGETPARLEDPREARAATACISPPGWAGSRSV